MFQTQILFTLLTLGFYQFLSIQVSASRYKHKIQAPKTTGNEEFESTYRAHLNYLENLVIFLPLMWIAGMRFNSNIVFLITCVVWLVSKYTFSIAYSKNMSMKIKLFSNIPSTVAVLVLFIMSILTLF
jgi:glutathione S-transferase